jgi:hypothetical protein
LRLHDTFDDEPGGSEGVDDVGLRSPPDVLGDFDSSLCPGVADQFGVEVPSLLSRQGQGEGVVKRDENPTVRGAGRGNEASGTSQSLRQCKASEGVTSSSDAVSMGSGSARSATSTRPRPPHRSLVCSTISGLIDADNFGAFAEQPLALGTRTATGVEEPSSLAGDEGTKRGAFKQPIERAYVGARRPDRC